jgi:hypothetical protein
MKNGLNSSRQIQDITVDPPNKKTVEKTINVQADIPLGRCKRCWVFVFIILVNIFINFDHGYFPAATEEFKKEYNITSSMLGLFGSSVYFGNLIGIKDSLK